MLPPIAVGPFVMRATDQLHLTAQLGQQRITAGLAQQQLGGPEQLQQAKAPGIATGMLQKLENTGQPAFIGFADLLGGYIHCQFGITARHGRHLVKLTERMLRAINRLHRVTANQFTVALHQKTAAALLPLLSSRTVDPGHVKPRQTR